MIDLNRIKKIHFIGIGGIGMSSLAQYFLNHGFEVSGSDISPSEITKELEGAGIKVFIGQKPANISSETDLIIYSAAINHKNPEFQKAIKSKINLASYAQIVGNLTKKYKTLAVSGAHGKSTTSAILSLILVKAKLDPTVIVGSKIKEFSGRNFRNGKGKYFVLESDEYSRAFLNYFPFGAIITNIDREHLDIYKNLSDIKKTFLKFINNISGNGILVINGDDKNIGTIKTPIEKICAKKKIRLIRYSTDSPVALMIKKKIKIPGKHNIANAVAAYQMAAALGVKQETIMSVIEEFTGIWRRLDLRGKYGSKIPVYDDYAHHPSEISATLQALKEKYPDRKIICVFQPHQAKRVKTLLKEFSRSFSFADFLLLLDIYRVPGRDISEKEISVLKLAQSIKNANVKISYVPEMSKIKEKIREIVKSNPLSVIVLMGAGNIYNFSGELVSR